ncbi:hypothetical protein FOFC_06965 [Fusarium oxysporum]|nr:hypothetical protein FOFC_06965 [Fusarium oxysporum]
MDYKQLILSRTRSKKSRSKKACGKAPSTQQERRCCRLCAPHRSSTIRISSYVGAA